LFPSLTFAIIVQSTVVGSGIIILPPFCWILHYFMELWFYWVAFLLTIRERWQRYRFWATVCKTVRPMLSDRCLSVLSVLYVTLVYCGQTVGRIKMKLGT